MNNGLFIRLGICLLVFGVCLYSYIDKQNELTSLKIKIPELAKEIDTLNQQIKRFQYEVDQFENPAHLMELAKHPEFSHLKHPLLDEVLTVQEGIALQEKKESNLVVSKSN